MGRNRQVGGLYQIVNATALIFVCFEYDVVVGLRKWKEQGEMTILQVLSEVEQDKTGISRIWKMEVAKVSERCRNHYDFCRLQNCHDDDAPRVPSIVSKKRLQHLPSRLVRDVRRQKSQGFSEQRCDWETARVRISIATSAATVCGCSMAVQRKGREEVHMCRWS